MMNSIKCNISDDNLDLTLKLIFLLSFSFSSLLSTLTIILINLPKLINIRNYDKFAKFCFFFCYDFSAVLWYDDKAYWNNDSRSLPEVRCSP